MTKKQRKIKIKLNKKNNKIIEIRNSIHKNNKKL